MPKKKITSEKVFWKVQFNELMNEAILNSAQPALEAGFKLAHSLLKVGAKRALELQDRELCDMFLRLGYILEDKKI